MTNFRVDSLPTPRVDEVFDTVVVDPFSSALADRIQSLAALGKDQGETRSEAELGDTTSVYKAKETVKANPAQLVEDTLVNQELTAEGLEEAFLDLGEKSEIEQELEDFYIENGILVKGVEYTPTDLRYSTNMLIAEQLFRDAISEAEEDKSVIGKIGDFVDRYMIRQIPIGMLEDITRRSERKGVDLMQAAITMNPAQYKEFISGYIEELKQEGFFLEGNIFALADGFEEARNAGYDPMADFNQLIALFEAGSIARGVKAGKLLKTGSDSLGHADNVVGRVAAVQGSEAATEVAEAILRASDEVDGTLLTKLGPSTFDEALDTPRTGSAKVMEIAENNQISRGARELKRSGAVGRTVDSEVISAHAATVAKEYSRRVTNPVYNHRIVPDVLEQPIAEVDFGKIKDGTPYSREADAQKVLNNSGLEEGFVAPVDAKDLSKGYVIRVQERVDLTRLVDELNPNQTEYGVIRENVARFFGSNAALDAEHLSALANMAETGVSIIKEIARPFEKALNKVPRDSKATIVRIYKELRDGKDAGLKEGYTRGEWIDKFKQNHPHGLAPTQRDLDAFDALVQFEDAGWLFRANEVLTKYVQKGYWALDLGDAGKSIGKKVDDLADEELVLNLETNLVDEFGSLPDEASVWRLDVPLEDGTQFVMRPKDVSILDHADVLGFNSGGRRINPKTNYFVVFDDSERPRAFLSTFSEKQARNAVRQFENIRDFIKAKGGKLDNIEDTTELDEVIRANNDWNPSVTSASDLIRLATEKNWDLTKKVSFKERGKEVENLSDDSPLGGEKWDGYVKNQLHRYNDVLLEYGGGEAFNVDPVNAILDEFANASTHYAHQAYTQAASAAWVKRAARKGSGVELSGRFPKDDYLNQLQHAEIEGNSASARKMRHLRSVIRRRLKMKGPVAQRFESMGQELAEAIFDTTGLKMNISDPSNALLHVGFQSAFGFFNVSQFFMQGMHAATVMATAPRFGLKAASNTLAIRAAIHAPTPEATKLAIKRLAGSMGESEETIQELVDYFRTSGRMIVEGDAIELGTGPSYGVSGWGAESYLPSRLQDAMQKVSLGGQAVLRAGLVPFRAGERLGRMTAITTSFLEFKAKNPKVSALSDAGRRWITTREQNLTFNMTAAGRSFFQSGIMKVPTQWLSYSFRSMESIILGRGFTPAERARLAAVLMPFYGLTGMGLGTAADWATEAFGIERPETFIAMKYGVLDWLIAEFTPVETTLSTRLAPITAFTDLYRKIVGGEASAFEIALGPSGDIAGGISKSFLGAVSELANGHTVSLQQDTLQILRQPSGLDNIAKGTGILVNGLYRSKTGVTLPTELKPADALISFLGFSPLEVSEFYSRKSGKFNSDKQYRTFSKEMDKDFDTALGIMKDNTDRGLKMLEEIDVKIALSGFSAAQQQQLKRNLMRGRDQQIYKLYVDLIRRDMSMSAAMLDKLLGGAD